jgi:DNA-binding response OmpR family regulator
MRIFIVEDEFLAAMLLEDELRARGWLTLGPFTTLKQARDAAETEQFDLAILDINLGGEMVYPLADELAARGIPFIFLSGYLSRDLPERFKVRPKLSKPFNAPLLHGEIERIRHQQPSRLMP